MSLQLIDLLQASKKRKLSRKDEQQPFLNNLMEAESLSFPIVVLKKDVNISQGITCCLFSVKTKSNPFLQFSTSLTFSTSTVVVAAPPCCSALAYMDEKWMGGQCNIGIVSKDGTITYGREPDFKFQITPKSIFDFLGLLVPENFQGTAFQTRFDFGSNFSF